MRLFGACDLKTLGLCEDRPTKQPLTGHCSCNTVTGLQARGRLSDIIESLSRTIITQFNWRCLLSGDDAGESYVFIIANCACKQEVQVMVV